MGLTEASVAVSRADLPAFAEREGGRSVVWLQGEHDASTVAALWDTIGRAMALDRGDLVIDLSGVKFMGSATVGVIIRARDSLRSRSRTLTMRSPSRCAQRVLDLYGLTDLLDARPVVLGTEVDSRSVVGRQGH
jgi:anti-anti-sigma factor